MSLQIAIDCPYRVPHTTLMAVKTCSKAILAHSLSHGKSPYFSEVTNLSLVDPDYPLLILPCADGAENMECAL